MEGLKNGQMSVRGLGAWPLPAKSVSSSLLLLHILRTSTTVVNTCIHMYLAPYYIENWGVQLARVAAVQLCKNPDSKDEMVKLNIAGLGGSIYMKDYVI